MEIALTHSGPIPFDDYPDHSLFLCRMCNLDSCIKRHNGKVLLLHHIKRDDYATFQNESNGLQHSGNEVIR